MHVSRAKTKECQFGNNYNKSVITYWADYSETFHAYSHPPGNSVTCVTVGMLLRACTCKKTVVPVSRTAEPIALKLDIFMKTG